MALAQIFARLTGDDLVVEAGATVETTALIGSTLRGGSDDVEEYRVQVRGLPERWYTLSTARIEVPAGRTGEVLVVISPPHDEPSTALGSYDFAVDFVPVNGEELVRLPGRLRALSPGGTTRRSRFVEYLPDLFQDDLFLARFLLIFQSVLDPVVGVVDQTHLYFDPDLTPKEWLEWLAGWVGMELSAELDEATKRELIRRAVELWRWKGTRRGLAEELKLRTGARPLIVENFDGLRLGQDAALGVNTHLGAHREGCIAVTLAARADGPGRRLDQRRADELVAAAKPAHVGHVVRVVPAPTPPVPGPPVTAHPRSRQGGPVG
jgi:phage tail-like protein